MTHGYAKLVDLVIMCQDIFSWWQQYMKMFETNQGTLYST